MRCKPRSAMRAACAIRELMDVAHKTLSSFGGESTNRALIVRSVVDVPSGRLMVPSGIWHRAILGALLRAPRAKSARRCASGYGMYLLNRRLSSAPGVARAKLVKVPCSAISFADSRKSVHAARGQRAADADATYARSPPSR